MFSDDQKKILDEVVTKIATSYQYPDDIADELKIKGFIPTSTFSYRKNKLKELEPNNYINSYFYITDGHGHWENAEHCLAFKSYREAQKAGNMMAYDQMIECIDYLPWDDILDIIIDDPKIVSECSIFRDKMEDLELKISEALLEKIQKRNEEYDETKEELRKALKKIDELETHIKYKPDGSGYKDAKENFDKTLSL